MPGLKSLPQFAGLEIPKTDELTVLVQGFGAVGANAAHLIHEQLEGAKVIGISDALGMLFDDRGLPVDDLFQMRQSRVSVTRPYFSETLVSDRWGVSRIKYSSASNDLLRESAFCMIPASPVSNYLDLDEETQPSVTVERMGKWALIIEGANIYSPEKKRKAQRLRMERKVYREKGVLIASDILVNSGGVIFAAQEQLIRTPDHLRIPSTILGDRAEVERWLSEHASELKDLADQRRKAAEIAREAVIRRNMKEMVELLISDLDLLPCEAAESISIKRVAKRESDRMAAEIMVPMPNIHQSRTIREAAAKLVETKCSILAVLDDAEELVGVVTDWDVTRSTAEGISKKQPLDLIMQREVIMVSPEEKILNIAAQA